MMPSRAFGASLFGLLALSACASLDASSDRVMPEKPLWLHHAGGYLSPFLRVGLLAQSRTVGERYERARAAVDPANGRVFIGTSDHGLYALHAGDGSTIWRYETLGAVQSEPYYDRELDYVYFGSNDGALYCVRAQDGHLVFRFNTGAEVVRRPVAEGETLFLSNAADNVFAIDRRNGKTLWHAHRTPALGMEISGHAGPSVSHGKVFMAYSDGHVAAYDSHSGAELWPAVDLAAEAEQSTVGQAPKYLDVDTTPIPYEGPGVGAVVLVASYEGGLFALDQEKGTIAWRNEKLVGATDLSLWTEPSHSIVGPTGAPEGGADVPARRYVIVSSATSGLLATDIANGHVVWRVPIPEGGVTAAVPFQGALLVGTSRYGLFLLSATDGKPIDGLDVGGGYSAAPQVFGGRAYILSNAGNLLGVNVIGPKAR